MQVHMFLYYYRNYKMSIDNDENCMNRVFYYLYSYFF